jgi:hypothetical protein
LEENYLNKNKYCCDELFFLFDTKKVRLFYDQSLRWYSLATTSDVGNQTLFYCFCCGKKFPKDLWKKWYITLKKEYKIKDPWEAFYEGKIPPEFMTDEWWKKRGL